MPTPHIHPWRTKHDLLTVRSLLYPASPSPSSQLQGLAIVDAWTTRDASTIPHPIAATAMLLDALLLHSSSTTTSPFARRGALGLAIARFVTGFCDTPPSTLAVARRSMYAVAEELRLPSEWVRMRHEITHGAMPGVDEMVDAARAAVGWLWERYWKGLDAGRAVVKAEEVREQLKAVVRERKMEIKGQENGVREILDGLVVRVDGDWTAVAKVLVEKRFMLAGLRYVLSWSGSGGWLMCDRQEQGMKVSFLVWDVPLRYLVDADLGFLVSLYEAFRNALLCVAEEEKEAIIQWIAHLISDQKWKQALLEQSSVEDVYTETMEFCLLNPGIKIRELGSLLLKYGSRDFKEDWIEIFTASELNEDDRVADGVVELQEREAMDLDSDAQIAHQPDEGGWNMLQGVWTPRPIGI
ncbi:Las1-domain-containing protein [Microthyrium microscopicum]|uniref:Las1-domain-containing protein n=1 Tax=Microthyrium microscopicum TaxID=703497 RepID=A0A6A6U5Q9_9PEZI|nr:Las1-domain-containing protein [Microthyrium microscopicum]